MGRFTFSLALERGGLLCLKWGWVVAGYRCLGYCKLQLTAGAAAAAKEGNARHYGCPPEIFTTFEKGCFRFFRCFE